MAAAAYSCEIAREPNEFNLSRREHRLARHAFPCAVASYPGVGETESILDHLAGAVAVELIGRTGHNGKVRSLEMHIEIACGRLWRRARVFLRLAQKVFLAHDLSRGRCADEIIGHTFLNHRRIVKGGFPLFLQRF